VSKLFATREVPSKAVVIGSSRGRHPGYMPEVTVRRGEEEGRVYVVIGGPQMPSEKAVKLMSEQMKAVKMSHVVNLVGCPEY
jgi:hypothetical protein